MILKGSNQYFYWIPERAAQKEDDRRQEIATLEKEIAALKELRLKNLRPAPTEGRVHGPAPRFHKD